MAQITKIVLVLEYEGTNYYGFQWQANQPTIQAELEKAIWKLTGERRRVISASRTDAGVHAEGQVVSFRTESGLLTRSFVKGLNFYLPADIAVRAAYRASESFNVRRDAVSREYHYYILNRPTRGALKRGFAYLVSDKLDIDSMNGAAQALNGKHNFASFITSLELNIKTTEREIHKAEFKRDGDLVTFEMVANSFLPHQVRNTVGALLRVGMGRMTAGEFKEIIEAKKPGLAGPTVPAHGLCLMRVNYRSPLEEICS
ncbi:MAG: tRNA pseudouridine(38-40) synthase TruA [Chloroflexota bacterium]